MRDKVFKIFILVVLMVPMWITLIFASEDQGLDSWKNVANKELLKMDEPRVQLARVHSASESFDASLSNLTIEIDTSSLKERGRSVLALRFKSETGQLVRHVVIEADAIIQKKIAVATRQLNRGETLKASDFRWEWREATNIPTYAIQGEAPIGRVLRASISQGAPLDANRFEAVSTVKKGARVQIKVVGKGITISALGVAQESGQVGQTIRVMNTDSKKEIFGTITGEEAVEVRI